MRPWGIDYTLYNGVYSRSRYFQDSQKFLSAEFFFLSWTIGHLLNSTVHWTHCTSISQSLVFIPVKHYICMALHWLRSTGEKSYHKSSENLIYDAFKSYTDYRVFCSSIDVDFILLFSSPFGFHAKNNRIRDWHKIRLSKYRQNFHLWLNYPFKLTVYDYVRSLGSWLLQKVEEKKFVYQLHSIFSSKC